MSTALWLPDVLSDAFRDMRGFQVDVVEGWRTRSAKATSFEPRGVINHHTGKGSYANLLQFMTTGSKTAPLCNVATSRPHPIKGIESVRITVCAAGRANHAGKGHLDWTGRDGGNRHSIGIENQNTGSQSWPDQQVEAIRIATAAVLRHLGVDVSRMADHKTYASNRKVDRAGVDLERERAAVRAILRGGGQSADEPRSSSARPARTHTVQRGDTLFAIGQKFGVRWQDIAEHNGIKRPEELPVGKVLNIP